MDTAQLLRGRLPQPEPAARETGWMVNGLRAFLRTHPPHIVKPLDLVAPDLVATVAALGEITGAAATEAILDGVFARFCIGK